jgi:hypothetical protein
MTARAAEPVDDVSAHAKALDDRLHETWCALLDALKHAGLIETHVDDTPMGRVFDRYWEAVVANIAYHRARWERGQQTLRRVLAIDTLTPQQRTAILSHLYGRVSGPRRDAMVLSPAEAKLITWYRQQDNDGRILLRMLANKLITDERTRDERR